MCVLALLTSHVPSSGASRWWAAGEVEVGHSALDSISRVGHWQLGFVSAFSSSLATQPASEGGAHILRFILFSVVA